MISLLIIGLIFMAIGLTVFCLFYFYEFSVGYTIASGVLFILGAFLIFVRVYVGRNVIKNRTVITRLLDDTEDRYRKILDDMFLELDFKRAKYGKEDVFRWGGSFFKIRSYAKYTIQDHEVIIEAWYSLGIGRLPNLESKMDDDIGDITNNYLEIAVEDIVERLDRILYEAVVVEDEN